jgi:hypothetical protein
METVGKRLLRVKRQRRGSKAKWEREYQIIQGRDANGKVLVWWRIRNCRDRDDGQDINVLINGGDDHDNLLISIHFDSEAASLERLRPGVRA